MLQYQSWLKRSSLEDWIDKGQQTKRHDSHVKMNYKEVTDLPSTAFPKFYDRVKCPVK
jgi:hypothetical protein